MAEITGVLYAKSEIQNITEKFSKVQVVIKTIEEYPQLIPLEFQNNKKDLPGSFDIGQLVKIDFNIQGREVIDTKGNNYFVTLRAWKISKFQ